MSSFQKDRLSQREVAFKVLEVAGEQTSRDTWETAKRLGLDKLMLTGGQANKERDYASMNGYLSGEIKRPDSMVVRTKRPKNGRLQWHYALRANAEVCNRHKIDRDRKDNYLYCISHPQTATPLYFGIGMRNGSETFQRALQHLKGQSHNKELSEAIAWMREQGIEPAWHIVYDGMDRTQAEIMEAKQIKLHGRRGIEPVGTLFNKQLRVFRRRNTNWDYLLR